MNSTQICNCTAAPPSGDDGCAETIGFELIVLSLVTSVFAAIFMTSGVLRIMRKVPSPVRVAIVAGVSMIVMGISLAFIASSTSRIFITTIYTLALCIIGAIAFYVTTFDNVIAPFQGLTFFPIWDIGQIWRPGTRLHVQDYWRDVGNRDPPPAMVDLPGEI